MKLFRAPFLRPPFSSSVHNFREIRVESRRDIKELFVTTKGHCGRVNSQWDLLKNPQDARTAVDLNGDASFTFLVLQRVAAGNWISRCYMVAFLHHWCTIRRFRRYSREKRIRI